ncbi:15088_t:CDS:2, partial [Acaulospora morrowiae]
MTRMKQIQHEIRDAIEYTGRDQERYLTMHPSIEYSFLYKLYEYAEDQNEAELDPETYLMQTEETSSDDNAKVQIEEMSNDVNVANDLYLPVIDNNR